MAAATVMCRRNTLSLLTMKLYVCGICLSLQVIQQNRMKKAEPLVGWPLIRRCLLWYSMWCCWLPLDWPIAEMVFTLGMYCGKSLWDFSKALVKMPTVTQLLLEPLGQKRFFRMPSGRIVYNLKYFFINIFVCITAFYFQAKQLIFLFPRFGQTSFDEMGRYTSGDPQLDNFKIVCLYFV